MKKMEPVVKFYCSKSSISRRAKCAVAVNASGNQVAAISDSGGGVFFKFVGDRKMVVCGDAMNQGTVFVLTVCVDAFVVRCYRWFCEKLSVSKRIG